MIEPAVGEIRVFELWRGEEAYEQGVLAAQSRLTAALESRLLEAMPALARALRRPEGMP